MDHAEGASVPQVLVECVGRVDRVRVQAGSTVETVASWPGARISPGNSSRNSAIDAARAAVKASLRDAVRSNGHSISRSCRLFRHNTCPPSGKAAGRSHPPPFPPDARSTPATDRCGIPDREIDRPGQLRTTKPIRARRQLEIQLDAFSRGETDLGEHVW